MKQHFHCLFWFTLSNMNTSAAWSYMRYRMLSISLPLLSSFRSSSITRSASAHLFPAAAAMSETCSRVSSRGVVWVVPTSPLVSLDHAISDCEIDRISCLHCLIVPHKSFRSSKNLARSSSTRIPSAARFILASKIL